MFKVRISGNYYKTTIYLPPAMNSNPILLKKQKKIDNHDNDK